MLRTRIGRPVHDDLAELWSIYGGQAYHTGSGGTRGLFGAHRLLSPAESGEEHESLIDNWLSAVGEPRPHPPAAGQEGGWNQGLVPMGSWDSYLLCVEAPSGRVWEFEPFSGLRREFSSIAGVLEMISTQIEASVVDEYDLLGPLRKIN